MTEQHITLYGDNSERFEEARKEADQKYPGSTPGNAELVLILLDEAGY
jgi:hypothetical protein